MAPRRSPEAWFWSHDIRSNQIDHVVTPGMRLIRLSSYGGERRRFAALIYKEPGPERTHALELEAEALAAQLRETGARPVAITTDPGDAGPRRFSVVLETGPGPLCSVHVDLDEAGVRALLDDRHVIADFVTYLAGGTRRYAVILEERAGPSWWLTGVTALELDARLLELDATLVRLREYQSGDRRELAAVAERIKLPGWAWYADLDGDAVARNLESNDAYPVDLDATRSERGVRFTVVMYKGR
jgi:Bacterial tandem repeat domain 1